MGGGWMLWDMGKYCLISPSKVVFMYLRLFRGIPKHDRVSSLIRLLLCIYTKYTKWIQLLPDVSVIQNMEQKIMSFTRHMTTMQTHWLIDPCDINKMTTDISAVRVHCLDTDISAVRVHCLETDISAVRAHCLDTDISAVRVHCLDTDISAVRVYCLYTDISVVRVYCLYRYKCCPCLLFIHRYFNALLLNKNKIMLRLRYVKQNSVQNQ